MGTWWVHARQLTRRAARVGPDVVPPACTVRELHRRSSRFDKYRHSALLPAPSTSQLRQPLPLLPRARVRVRDVRHFEPGVLERAPRERAEERERRAVDVRARRARLPARVPRRDPLRDDRQLHARPISSRPLLNARQKGRARTRKSIQLAANGISGMGAGTRSAAQYAASSSANAIGGASPGGASLNARMSENFAASPDVGREPCAIAQGCVRFARSASCGAR
jgi:hypothetical protein